MQESESPNPVLVEVFRKNTIESRHRGAVAVVDGEGRTVLAIGDISRIIFPRSSIKLFQALPLIETGAADRFSLASRDIALACASHNGENGHVTRVRDWLAALDLEPDQLENGPSLPYSATAAREMLKAGEEPTRAHHNCSGKHTGMLTVARHLGLEVAGYTGHRHGVQRAWMHAMSELVGLDVESLDWERDGCGAPAISMPLESLAHACARYAAPDRLGGTRAHAVRRILDSVSAHPWMIAGTGRCCTDVIRMTAGRVVVKTGAEAVYAGVLPGQGLGLALKIDDGSTRASAVALGELLCRLGAISDDEYRALHGHFRPDILNSNGDRTGCIAPSEPWGEWISRRP